MAKRGKIISKCENNGDICLRASSNGDNTNFEGSPLSLRYQGVWYLAGLGISANVTKSNIVRFTPLWTVNSWIATTIHEIDSKCQFQTSKLGTNALCERLNIKGLVDSNSVISV